MTRDATWTTCRYIQVPPYSHIVELQMHHQTRGTPACVNTNAVACEPRGAACNATMLLLLVRAVTAHQTRIRTKGCAGRQLDGGRSKATVDDGASAQARRRISDARRYPQRVLREDVNSLDYTAPTADERILSAAVHLCRYIL
ncbi:hypothetical protein PLICRDRAFT_296515 [Plicaturopsis crispa FD-325 SS-3]|nr:hypothetical protein PLICRDRAFT_296515 [Plicaturopsis crispa FD-325 SS-3]